MIIFVAGQKTPGYKVRFITLINGYHLAIKRIKVMAMYTIRNIRGHIQVYDAKGNFLFSADNERELREELKDYAEFAA